MKNYAEFLRELSFFRDFELRELQAILGIMKQHDLPPGKEVFADGSVGSSCFIIAEGEVRVHITRKGRDETLAHLGPGMLFGQMALLDGGRRAASCSTSDDTVLFELDQGSFNMLFQSGSPVAFKFMDSLTQVLVASLRGADDRLTAMASGPSTQDDSEASEVTIPNEMGEMLAEISLSSGSWNLNDVWGEDGAPSIWSPEGFQAEAPPPPPKAEPDDDTAPDLSAFEN